VPFCPVRVAGGLWLRHGDIHGIHEGLPQACTKVPVLFQALLARRGANLSCQRDNIEDHGNRQADPKEEPDPFGRSQRAWHVTSHQQNPHPQGVDAGCDAQGQAKDDAEASEEPVRGDWRPSLRRRPCRPPRLLRIPIPRSRTWISRRRTFGVGVHEGRIAELRYRVFVALTLRIRHAHHYVPARATSIRVTPITRLPRLIHHRCTLRACLGTLSSNAVTRVAASATSIWALDFGR
jgi:hypothetical protein